MSPSEAYNELGYYQGLTEEEVFDLECIVAECMDYSRHYARFLNSRFILGELRIALNSRASFFYASDTIKGHWPLGEKATAKIPHYHPEFIKNKEKI